MKPEDPTPDMLTRDYQRASAAEAGRPSDATRAAIIAEARAAALRRAPAANDSRYVWRAVAGIAVVGVALLLWRQAAPVATTAQTSMPLPSMSADSKTAPEPYREPEARAEQPAEQPAAVAKLSRQAVAKAERELPAMADTALSRGFAEKSSGAGAGAASGAVAAPAAAPPASITAASEARSADAENANVSNLSARAVRPIGQPDEWILTDRDGTRLQQGRFAPGETLESIRADLMKRYPGRSIGAWVVTSQSAAAQLE